jgi:hypothetical protein
METGDFQIDINLPIVRAHALGTPDGRLTLYLSAAGCQSITVYMGNGFVAKSLEAAINSQIEKHRAWDALEQPGAR